MLPAGVGKDVTVAVFADPEFHPQLKEVGADLIGDSALLQKMAKGEIEFDKIIATNEFMKELRPLARILGPKGLMPNVKSGTLVQADTLLESVK